MKKLTESDAAKIVATIVELTGVADVDQLAKRPPTKERWREAYERAGVPYFSLWKERTGSR